MASQHPDVALLPLPHVSVVGAKVFRDGAGETVGANVVLATTVTARAPPVPTATDTVIWRSPAVASVPTSRTMDCPAEHPASVQLLVSGVQSASTVFP